MNTIFKIIIAFIFTVSVIFATLPIFAHAKTDASISQTSLTFSQETVTAGDVTRIYARVLNTGDTDITGSVIFFNNGKELAAPQPISIKPGTYDDVFIDWQATAGNNNISAKITGAAPADENTTNNSTAVKSITVVAKTTDATSETVEVSETPTTTETKEPSKIQETYNSFAQSNPIKSGILSFENAVNDQVVKWYQLATNNKNLPAIPSMPASLKDAFAGPGMAYMGVGMLGVIVLWWMVRKFKNRGGQDNSSEEE